MSTQGSVFHAELFSTETDCWYRSGSGLCGSKHKRGKNLRCSDQMPTNCMPDALCHCDKLVNRVHTWTVLSGRTLGHCHIVRSAYSENGLHDHRCCIGVLSRGAFRVVDDPEIHRISSKLITDMDASIAQWLNEGTGRVRLM